MDASDTALCALVPSARLVLCYRFSDGERQLIQATKTAPAIGFAINYRELLSCAVAVHTWGQPGAEQGSVTEVVPVHVQFRIDNMSVVAWQSKLASCNPRAPDHHSSSWSLGSGTEASSPVYSNQTNGGHLRSGSNQAYYPRAHSVAAPTNDTYRAALQAWYSLSSRSGIHPVMIGYSMDAKIQAISDFIIHGFQYGYGSSRPIRGATIAATLHGIVHFFQAAALNFPSNHPQIRMVLKGSYRLNGPVCHKTPSRLSYSNAATGPSICRLLPTKVYEGALCMAFFFLLRRSEIASKGKTHFHGSLSRQLT
ncbi:hypothetical protein PC128_g5611 [Phytophthora cactorum]|nr:hypothetical protein PC128_g5611 [Phytophthora cactorum]